MKISIVTPNYNYASYIAQTIESVIQQNYADFEYIIVDDGSTDNSVEVIRRYADRYPENIILVRQENKGQTPAINVGMKQVTGDVVCWINSDDTFCPGVFLRVAECFKNNKAVDIVFGDMNVTDLEGNFMYRRRHLDFNYTTACLLGFTTVFSSNAVFWKREAMQANGYFNEALKCNMDGDFFSRLVRNRKVKRIPLPIANFRKQPFTKAAEHDKNWDALVKREVGLEREDAYAQLAVSAVVPFRYSGLVKLPFQALRVLKRALRLHFVRQRAELNNYKAGHPA